MWADYSSIYADEREYSVQSISKGAPRGQTVHPSYGWETPLPPPPHLACMVVHACLHGILLYLYICPWLTIDNITNDRGEPAVSNI